MIAPATTQSEEKKRDNYIILPNMASDDLNIYEFRLLGHYTRVCGQGGGRCWQGIKTIHEKTGMSLGMITKTRKSLEAKGYIVVSVPDGKSRNRGASICVTIVDKWEENSQRYCKETRTANAEKRDNVLPQTILAVSQHETKNKKKYKKPERQEEQKTTTTLPAVNLGDPTPENFSSSDVIAPAFQVKVYFPNVLLLPANVPEHPDFKAKAKSAPPPISAPPPPPVKSPDEAKYERVTDHFMTSTGQLIRPLVEPMVQSDIDTYSEAWLNEAIDLAVSKDKLFWEFVHGILERWKAQGGTDSEKAKLKARKNALPEPVYEFPVYDDLPDVPLVPAEPVDPLWQQLCRAVKNWSTPLFLDCMKKCSFGGFADGILSIYAPDDKCGAKLNHQRFLEREAEGIWTDFKSVNFIVKGVT